MSKKKVVVYLILLVGIGYVLGSCTVTPDKVYVKSKPEIIRLYDSKTKTVTKEVPRPETYECRAFIRATYELRDAQKVLSQTKKQMLLTMQDITKMVGNQDAVQVVRLKKEVIVLMDTMENAWNAVGDAAATLDKYSLDDNPC